MSWRSHRPTKQDHFRAQQRQRRLTEAEQKQSKANKEAQQSGANAEWLVEEQSALYLRDQSAYVRKRYEPYRRVGRAGKGNMFKAVPTGASGPDFEVWLRDGRAGLIEVKSRKGARIELAAIGDTQALALRRMSEWGHLALVLVRLNHEWFLVSYEAWTHHKKRSLNREDLSVQGVRCPVDTDNKPDFLSVLDDAIRVGACYASSLPSREDRGSDT